MSTKANKKRESWEMLPGADEFAAEEKRKGVITSKEDLGQAEFEEERIKDLELKKEYIKVDHCPPRAKHKPYGAPTEPMPIWNLKKSTMTDKAYLNADDITYDKKLFEKDEYIHGTSVFVELAKDCYTLLKSGPGDEPIPDEKRRFMCPIHARDPAACEADFRLTTLKDVVEHLEVRHPRVEVYCPTCSKAFDDVEARDRHVRNQLCIFVGLPRTWGITNDEARRLKEIAETQDAKTVYDEMYKVMQPGTKRKHGPYLGDYDSFVISTVVTAVQQSADILPTPYHMQEDPAAIVEYYAGHLIEDLLAPRVRTRLRRFNRKVKADKQHEIVLNWSEMFPSVPQ